MTRGGNPALQMLATALEMEERGRSFYEKTVATCRNEMGKEIFRLLMGDEIAHVDRIRVIYDSLAGGESWSEEWRSIQRGHKDLKLIFQELTAKHDPRTKTEASDLEALEVGIGLEVKAVGFYEGCLAKATDPRERSFLERMLVEERSHHAALTNMKAYFTDPASWFLGSEKGGLDGA